jgi:hypothetical protein
MTGILRIPRRAALAAIAVLVAAASLVSFAESYRGLYDWAREHGLAGPWAVIWPLQWGDVAARLASRFPARWEGAAADAVAAECRALGVPSVNVKAAGVVRKGCRRGDVEPLAGAQ